MNVTLFLPSGVIFLLLVSSHLLVDLFNRINYFVINSFKMVINIPFALLCQLCFLYVFHNVKIFLTDPVGLKATLVSLELIIFILCRGIVNVQISKTVF